MTTTTFERFTRVARRGSGLTRAGLILLGVLVLVAAAAPLITTGAPNQQDLGGALAAPSLAHPIGTDQLGRDVWTRIVYAIRTDVLIAVAATAVSATLGIIIGLIAGYAGGWIDAVISRVIDVFAAFPLYLLLIALVFLLGPGVPSMIVAFSLVSWIVYARLTRAQVLSLRTQDYIVAARLGGLSRARVLRRHILPNVIGQSVVFSTSDIVVNILTIVTLGYLGLGVPAPTPEWGAMIAEAQPFIVTQWWLIVAPGVAVALTGLALSLLSDGLTKDWRVHA